MEMNLLILSTAGFLFFLPQESLNEVVKCNGNCKCYDQGLDCSGKGIHQVVFHQKTFEQTIKKINLKRNNITEIPEYNCTYINYLVEEINFDSNKIESITTDMIGRTFPMLNSISFLRNRIKKIREGDFLFLTQLQHLDIGDNQIREIEPGAFFSQKKLHILRLERNQLKVIEPLAFQGLQNLKVLKMEHNNLTLLNSEWFKQIPRLENLSVKANSVKNLQPFDMKWPKSLKKIDLSENKLQYIPNFPSFENVIAARESLIFDLSNNDINCDCVLSDIRKYKSDKLFKFVCGIKLDCNFPTKSLFSFDTRVCSEEEGVKYIAQLQNQPICQVPKLQLRISRGHDGLTKLQCEGQGEPTPEVTIKNKDGQIIPRAKSEGNKATLNISSEQHSISDLKCVATNMLGSTQSSRWLISKMVSTNESTHAICNDKPCELKSCKRNNFVLPYIVFSLCMFINVTLAFYLVLIKCSYAIQRLLDYV